MRHPNRVASWLTSGVNLALEPGAGFTTAYFVHPRDVTPLLESHGFRTLRVAGAEGAVSIEDRVNQLEGDSWQAWADLNYRLGEDPSLRGACEHLLYVGAKLTISAGISR